MRILLVHKEFVDKVYQYQNLAREIEEVEKEIETFIFKSANLSLEEQTYLWKEIHTILKHSATSHDPELAIAQLDLIIAQIRVKRLEQKAEATQPENILKFEKSEVN